MKNIIVLLISVLVISCSDKEYNSVKDIGVDIAVKNDEGMDLLNPESPDSYHAEDIKLFYLANGEKKEVYNGRMDLPRNFKIYRPKDEFRIGIVANNERSEKLPITYVQWNETDIDTIQCEFRRSSNAVICTKVWFNDELSWDAESQTERFFTIIK